MKEIFLLLSLICLLGISCNKSSTQDLSGKGFIVAQVASCNNGIPEITNLSTGDLYVTFNSSTFRPTPNTWYRASNPGVPCGSCNLLFRFKIGSNASPVDAPFTSDADPIALTPTSICN